jgi:hypothetical protein
MMECMAGLPPVLCTGWKNSAPTDQVNDGRGQRGADRLRKVGEVSRGIEKRPEGRLNINLYLLNCKNQMPK